jgi:hypothetical protein
MRSSSESECICDGKITKKIVLRIFDNRLVYAIFFKLNLSM